jgi:hypothetical protein
MGNMGKMMQQIQKMQKEIEDLQEELAEQTVEATVGGGVVTVVANGKQEIVDISISEEVVDPDDVEMLQDLIVAATNEAMRKAQDMVSEEMAKITGGLNIPGLPGLPG